MLVGLIVASVGLCLPTLPAEEADPRPTEYEVKAAYIYNFVRFIEWPPEAFPHEGAPFIVAVLGDDPFGRVLDDVFLGKTLAGRASMVVRIQDPEQADEAQIVFIAASEVGEVSRIAGTLARRSILTVGDVPGMARQGTIIAFREEGSRIRFDINIQRAEDARLKLSSQLLRVATIVSDAR